VNERGDDNDAQRAPPSADLIESLLFQFESLWRGDAIPDLGAIGRILNANHAPSSGEHRSELLAELVKIDMEYRWRRFYMVAQSDATDEDTSPPVNSPQLTDYLQLFDELKADSRTFFDLILEEYRVRRRWGDQPSAPLYCTTYPHFAEELPARFLEIDSQLDEEAQRRDNRAVSEDLTPEKMSPQDESDFDFFPDSQHSDFLREIEPFDDLPPKVVNAMAFYMQLRQFEEGELLLKQGGPVEYLAVVVSGEAKVTLIDDTGSSHEIDTDGRGAVFGEMALMTGGAPTANVAAQSQVSALILPADAFHRLMQHYPPLGVAFAHLIATRLGRSEVDAFYDKTIGGYRIKRRLGHGGMGVVYEAQEISSGDIFALKMMKHRLAFEREAMRRFRQEADIVRSLACPQIVSVHRTFAAHSTQFIVMDLCDGLTLAQLVRRAEFLSDEQIKPILGQLALALAYAHANQVVHRDLKPANVMINREGQLKLTDFGLAKALMSPKQSHAHAIVGTPSYMPPEQAFGAETDHRSDIYSFGCIAYELLWGEPAFHDDSEGTNLYALHLQWAKWSLDDALSRPLAYPDQQRHLSLELKHLLQQSLQIDVEQRILNLNKIASWAAPIDTSLLGDD